jgi:uncharacterized protein YlxW (UPF0749 family)
MKNSPQKRGLWNRKYFVILTVCIITGFIIGYSYNLSKDNQQMSSSSSLYTQQRDAYREELIDQQERNKELAEELDALQVTIRKYEKEYATHEERYDELVEEAERLRILMGELPVAGKGIAVTLRDDDYSGAENPNDYIVHESHVFNVINELKISGAEAIAINGQRLKTNSYIICNGPVITIDGNQYPAPFVIEAVGDQNGLIGALEIGGGVFDQLLNDNVVVTVEKKAHIVMPSITKGNF